MTPEAAAEYFTGADGRYDFARWGVPVAAQVFGAGRVTGEVMAGALAQVSALTGHPAGMASGLAHMTYGLVFLTEWRDLAGLPGLGALLPDTATLAASLARRGANQYRVFSRGADGSIARCFGLVKLAGTLGQVDPAILALRQAALAHLTWSIPALTKHGPVAPGPDGQGLRPEIAALLRAAYRPDVPVASSDPAHAALLSREMAA